MNKRKEKLKPGEIVPLTFDYVFTAIFNNPNNMDLIEYFLSDYLSIPYNNIKGNIEIQPRELELQHKKDRNIQVDLIIHFGSELINIELSNRGSESITERNVVSACSIHSRQLKYGDNSYAYIERTLQIQLNNFRCNEKNIKESFLLINKNGEILSKKFQIDVIDMVLGSKLWYTSKDEKLTRWCKVFTATTEKELKEAIGDDLMSKESNEKLIEEIDKYSKDEEIIGLFMKLPKRELEQNTFIEEARIKGFSEGIEQKNKETAKKMIYKKFDIETIMGITGLSKEEVEQIKKDLSEN